MPLFSEHLLKDGVSGVSDGTSTTKDLSDGTSNGVSDIKDSNESYQVSMIRLLPNAH